MEQRILTAMTQTMSTVQSKIRSELGNFPSGTTKFTVIHRRPVSSLTVPFKPSPLKGQTANSMCRYSYHPIFSSSASSSDDRTSVTSSSSHKTGPATTHPQAKRQASGSKNQQPARKIRSALKRSLSADHLNEFQPMPAKRPFPVQIWFKNRPSGPRLPVATSYWQDSPLHDSLAFVYTKLLEASQARRYLQLQSKPRKYLHLTGGGIHAIVPPPPSRKPEIMLPPMVVKMRPSLPVKPIIVSSPQPAQQRPIKKMPIHHLPPPPPLISLSGRDSSLPLVIKINRSSTPPQQEHPLELCKRRKESEDGSSVGSCSPSPDSPRLVINHSSAPSSPLNLAVHNDRSSSAAAAMNGPKRKISLPPISLPSVIQHEPLDLATPSPTVAFRQMTLTEERNNKKSPVCSTAPPTSAATMPKDPFLLRLVLVLQVLLGKRRLLTLGHPQVAIEDILARVLQKAGVTPVKDVRTNWISFLRLCVKNEDAWKREGWDRKTPDAILDEIYMQGMTIIVF